MSVVKCPNCGKKLTEIQTGFVDAEASYIFSEKRGKYILYTSVVDFENFICPKCNSEIPMKLLKDHVDKNLQIVRFSGIHKPLLIDLQEQPFDIKAIEYQESLNQIIDEFYRKDRSEKDKKN